MGLPDYFREIGTQKMLLQGKCCAEFNQGISFSVVESETAQELAIAAFFVTHEHHSSILDLLINNRLGSALALLRPCVEALVCGLWLLRGATQENLVRFVEQNITPPIESMFTGLRKNPDVQSDAFLEKTWHVSKQSLHRYTHCSYQLLARRAATTPGAAVMTPDEVVDAIRFASSAAMLATVELADLGGDLVLRDAALRLLTELHQGVLS
jgi:hypothetical protein